MVKCFHLSVIGLSYFVLSAMPRNFSAPLVRFWRHRSHHRAMISIKMWLTFIKCLSSGTSNENFEQANAQKTKEGQRQG